MEPMKLTSAYPSVSGALAICISATMWGFDGIVLTPRLYNLDVAWVVFVLHLIPFGIMNLFLFREYGQLNHMTSADLGLFSLVALCGGAVGTLAIVKALFLVNFQHLTVVVLLQKLQPVFALLLAAIVLKERLSATFAGWAALAIITGYFLTFGLALPNLDTGAETVYAALFALLAAVSFGSSTVFSKKVLQKYSFRTATFYRYGFTALLMLLYVSATGRWSQLELTTSFNWLIFFIIGVTTGSGAIFLYYFGLRHVSAMVSTICELFFPLSAILFDYLFNDVRLSPVQWLSAAVMIFAILRISLKGTKPSRHHRA